MVYLGRSSNSLGLVLHLWVHPEIWLLNHPSPLQRFRSYWSVYSMEVCPPLWSPKIEQTLIELECLLSFQGRKPLHIIGLRTDACSNMADINWTFNPWSFKPSTRLRAPQDHMFQTLSARMRSSGLEAATGHSEIGSTHNVFLFIIVHSEYLWDLWVIKHGGL